MAVGTSRQSRFKANTRWQSGWCMATLDRTEQQAEQARTVVTKETSRSHSVARILGMSGTRSGRDITRYGTESLFLVLMHSNQADSASVLHLATGTYQGARLQRWTACLMMTICTRAGASRQVATHRTPVGALDLQRPSTPACRK